MMLKFVVIGELFRDFKGGFALPTDIAGISAGVVTDLHAGYIRRQSRLLCGFRADTIRVSKITAISNYAVVSADCANVKPFLRVS